ncbi:kinase-like protein [Gymnopus androsaceus JB14]|uniref:Kinase-like protein n=1 Tax=Gymnopus androsaceus JB14 TaxID=1447944 RepID=A0A6A4GFF1_9AGAR|nr:kinase-like protein [Gymnopus androsaceus JB14]
MDIKPDNLVLDMDRDRDSITLKVIDFNISIIGTSHDVRPGRRGTTGYMAPEVIGPRQYSPILADLYSCGICMRDFLKVDRRGRRDRDDSLLFEAFVDFAERLCNQCPSKRPPLTKRPKIKEHLTEPQRDANATSSGRVVG